MDPLIIFYPLSVIVVIFYIPKFVKYKALFDVDVIRHNGFSIPLILGLFTPLITLLFICFVSAFFTHRFDLVEKAYSIIFSVIGGSLVVMYLERYSYQVKQSVIAKNPIPEPELKHEPEPQVKYLKVIRSDFINVPDRLWDLVESVISCVPEDQLDYEYLKKLVNKIAEPLPHHDLVEVGRSNTCWGDYTDEARRDGSDPKAKGYKEAYAFSMALNALNHNAPQVYKDLLNTPIRLTIPEKLRTSHHHIVAGTGRGKSQCIQSMFIDDLKTDASIVVIDSQGDLINSLATRVPAERLILIDPETCPPALNLFANQSDERQVATAIELYEYIFSALDASMTSKQQTVYRFVCRLLLTIPGANIHTMREILEEGGGKQYQSYINQLGETIQSFFNNEFNNPKSKQYTDTKKEILRRLYTVLENTTLEKMLGSSSSSLDIPSLLDSGKVILISTAKNYLKQTGASLFGRIFISQVVQAVMSRTANRRTTYMYIDEFQDYADESSFLFNAFEQSRKYNLGLIVAHQYLGQLPPKLLQSISANTAIKFASGVSAGDATALAKMMHTTPEFIRSQPVGTFASYFRDKGTYSFPIEIGRLDRVLEQSNLSQVQADMRKRYGAKAEPRVPLYRVADSDVPKYNDDDIEDR